MNPASFPLPSDGAAVDATTRRKNIRAQVMLTIGGALVGGAIGAGIGRLVKMGSNSGVGEVIAIDLWTLAALPVMWLVVVLAHEFGHLLGGRFAGMKPMMLFAGPLHFEFGADRLRLRFNRVKSTWGGLAACAPSGNTDRGGLALLVLGGPLASFVLAAVTLPAGLALGGWWGGLLFCTGALSVVIGVATLMPLRAGGYMSDGGQLLGLLRNDPQTGARLALSSLMAQSYAGTRPRDWDPALLAAIDGDGGGDASLQGVTAMLVANRHEDRREFAQADSAWRRVAEVLVSAQGADMPAAAKGGFALPIAAWLGHHRRDAAAARAWLDASCGGFSDPASRAYAEAAVLHAEGQADAARRAIADARAALPQVGDRGGALALADWLDELERDLGTPAPHGTALAPPA
jgi:hypothetical protein